MKYNFNSVSLRRTIFRDDRPYKLDYYFRDWCYRGIRRKGHAYTLVLYDRFDRPTPGCFYCLRKMKLKEARMYKARMYEFSYEDDLLESFGV